MTNEYTAAHRDLIIKGVKKLNCGFVTVHHQASLLISFQSVLPEECPSTNLPETRRTHPRVHFETERATSSLDFNKLRSLPQPMQARFAGAAPARTGFAADTRAVAFIPDPS